MMCVEKLKKQMAPFNDRDDFYGKTTNWTRMDVVFTMNCQGTTPPDFRLFLECFRCTLLFLFARILIFTCMHAS